VSHFKGPQNVPNGRKIYQFAIKYNKIFHCINVKNLAEHWYFWFEYVPSGNPGVTFEHEAQALLRGLEPALVSESG
jgi:hypothetical protein